MMLYAYQQKSIRKKDEMPDSAHPEITQALRPYVTLIHRCKSRYAESIFVCASASAAGTFSS